MIDLENKFFQSKLKSKRFLSDDLFFYLLTSDLFVNKSGCKYFIVFRKFCLNCFVSISNERGRLNK
jgi:hypothetical protein